MNLGSVDYDNKNQRRGSTNLRKSDVGMIRLDEADDEDADEYETDQHSRSVLIHQQTRQAIEDLCRMSQEVAQGSSNSLLTRKYRENQMKKNRSKLTLNEESQDSKPRYEQCEESEATMGAERDDIMRMMLGGQTSEDSYTIGGHQLNQRDVSFGHDEESAARESIEVCSANNFDRRSLNSSRPAGPRMS